MDDQGRLRLGAAASRTLAARPWAQAAWLYGSVARTGRGRDVDLGVLAEPVPEQAELASAAAEIARGVGLRPDDIDLRLLNGGDPVFLGNVLRDGRLLFERDRERRVRFEVYALNQWLDFAPVWERLRQRVLTRWSHG